jgi:hypothetical protein
MRQITPPIKLLLLLISLSRLTSVKVTAFCPVANAPSRQLIISFVESLDKDQTAQDDNAPKSTPKKPKGDSLRSATGIRPSLHPVTINCIAEALLLRSKQTKETIIDTANPDAEPIQIAITAGGIALNAIEQRKAAAETDETTDSFSMEESNAISGRVVGVVMRMRELEQMLRTKVTSAEYVWKYGEEMSFGLTKSECKEETTNETLEKELADNIKMNPLLRMNRAECLLALFLETVEKPKLEMLGEEVAGGSKVDFIDEDRLEVLFKE